MTEERRGPGRPKLYPVRIVLPLTAEQRDGIDAARRPEEDRCSFVRSAIDIELARRRRIAQRHNVLTRRQD